MRTPHLFALALACLPCTGCISLLGPEDLRFRTSLASGVDIDREFAVGVDGLTVSLAAALATDIPIRGVTWADVGMYRIRNAEEAEGVLDDLELPGYHQLVRIREGTSETLVLVKQSSRSVSGVSVFQRDGDELVIVRVKGFIGHLIQHILEHESIPGLEDFMSPPGGDDAESEWMGALARNQ